MQKITPTVDIAFKKLFGVEENKDLLKSLINSIVFLKDQVADLEILNPYTSSSRPGGKLFVLDIKAISVAGTVFNVEMQVTNEAGYHNRALCYWSKLYSNQVDKGDDYTEMKKVIGIHILNHNCLPQYDRYHNVFKIFNYASKCPHAAFDHLELHTLELKKFLPNKSKDGTKLIDKLKKTMDVWAAFLADRELLAENGIPKNLDSAPFEKAMELMDRMNLSKEESDLYDDRIKWLMIEHGALKKMELEGIEKGKTETQYLIAKNMKASKIAINEISRMTGLTIKEIEKL